MPSTAGARELFETQRDAVELRAGQVSPGQVSPGEVTIEDGASKLRVV